MENSQASMDDHHHHHQHTNNSIDKFSFPIIPVHEKEFEFGNSNGITPTSPSSPADHLFSNGKLLPHSFPIPIPIQPAITYSRSTSGTSSVSSKDSLFSSRSNSVNSSRNSSSSSARTSVSESVSDRKLLLNHQRHQAGKVAKDLYQVNKKLPSLNTQYGSSRRWQFITPIPALNRQVSRSKKKEKSKEDCKDINNKTNSKGWFGERFFMSFVTACIECHAMKTSSRVSVSCQE